MAAAAVGGAVVASMPPLPEEQPLVALVAPAPPQPEGELLPPVAADAVAAPTPPPQPEGKEDEQPPVAADALVAPVPTQQEAEQPPAAADAVVVVPTQQPREEKGELPPKPADAVSEAVSIPPPMPSPPPPPPQPQQQQQQEEEPEGERPVPAAALPLPLESGLGPVEEECRETRQDENPLQVQGSADEGDKETPQDKNPIQVPGPADEGDKDASQDKNLVQAPGPADEGDKDTSQDKNLVQAPGPADEGDKDTSQDKNPIHVPGPADEGDKETPQDGNPLQVQGPADEGDKDTSQDENLLQDSDSADEGDKDIHDHGNHSPGGYPRDYFEFFHRGYPREYELFHRRRYPREYFDMDDGDYVPEMYGKRLGGPRCRRDHVDPCRGGRCRGDHRDHSDCVEALHGGRCRGDHRDHSDCVDALHGGRCRGDHRDHCDCVDALHGGRCRGDHRDHSDCVDAPHGGRCRGDHRDHRDNLDELHVGRHGEQGDHRDYDHAFRRGRYYNAHMDHRSYFLKQRNHRGYDHAFHDGKYPMNGFCHDNLPDYAHRYLDSCHCMKCTIGGRRSHWDYTNQYNPMDSLDDKRVYAHTPCCYRKLICEKNDYPVGASLLNPEKWTCFLNCILQCVVHTVPLVSKLLKYRHLGLCPSHSGEFCCYCSLRHHASECIRLSGNVLYPKKFVKLLKLISQDFSWGGHQDAHEYLRCLLDKLDDASVALRLSSDEPSSIVKEVFGGQLKSQLHCPECNHCSDRLESFLDLSLEINQMDTLLDSLESFTKVEVVESFICDGCKSRVNMEKHLKVEQAPEVLVIQLKRFENMGSNTSKIQEMVKYQLELDLKPFMSSEDTNPQKYDLYGVVEHLGNSSKGHYVCYIRSSETDWYLFNDDKVMKLSEDSVLDSKAYLLFYVKQGSSPWFSSLLDEKDNLLSGYMQELTEKGLNEDGVPIDSDKGSYSGSGIDSDEQDSAEYSPGGPAARNEAGPSLVDMSQGNANGSMNIPDKNEASSSLGGGLSGETQKPTSSPRSSLENGNACGLALLLKNNENVSLQGSHGDKEMSHSAHGSPSQVNCAGSQGSNHHEENRSLLQSSSHKHEDGCCPENLTLRKNDETIGSCDSPAGEVRAHYGVETRARKRMRQQSAAGTTAKRKKQKKDGSLKKSLWKKRSAGRAARGRSKKKRR